MTTSNLEHFEQVNFRDKQSQNNPDEHQRIKDIIDAISLDVQNILDIGCGSGFLLNTLILSKPGVFNRFAGLDVSSEAPKLLKCEAYSERHGGFKYFVCGASRIVVGGRIYNRQTE